MKTPFAVTFGDLAAHFAGSSTTGATLFKVKRKDGVILGFTDCDSDLAFDDLSGDGLITYKAATGYRRGAFQNGSDLTPPSVQLIAVLDSTGISESDVRAGAYDRAEVAIYLVNHADLRMGAYWLKRGFLGESQIIDNYCSVELLGLTDAYTQQFIDIYTRDCSTDLFSSLCKIDPAPFTDSAVVASVGLNRHSFTATITPLSARADGFYDQGSVIWLTGNNAGRTSEIKTTIVSTGATVLFLPVPFAIQIGDTLNIRAGCDKLRETCRDKFGNIVNFRGPAWACPDLDAVTKTPSLL